MKYMLLIYQNPAAWQTLSEEERTSVMNEAGDLWKELSDSGEWVGGEALADVSTTKTVRVRGGVPAVTDGPYIEAKEYLAGYLLVECENEERAVAIAARWRTPATGRWRSGHSCTTAVWKCNRLSFRTSA